MSAAFGAIAAAAGAAARNRRENEKCWDCHHRRIDHRRGGCVEGCDCERFTDTAHIKIGVCRVCDSDVFHDTQVFAMPPGPSDVAQAARALSLPPVCSPECARLVTELELRLPKGWRPGWRHRSG